MIRNLKTLALMVGAVFVLTGLGAPSASATAVWFEGETGIETITAEQEPGTSSEFTMTEGTRASACGHVQYTNQTNTVDTTESEIELTPTYGECSVVGLGSAQINVNGCDFRFHNPTTNAEGRRTANAQITCPVNQAIEIEVKLFGTLKCLITVGAQTPAGHVTFTNVGSGSERIVTANITLEKIHYVEHGKNMAGVTASGFATCDSPTGEVTGNDATFSGLSIITGRTHAGVKKGVWVDQ